MIQIMESADEQIIKSILLNPILFRLTSGQAITLEEFKLDLSWTYLILKNNRDTIGCFQVKELTKTVLEAHIYILPKYWGRREVIDSIKSGHEWVKMKGYLKTFTRVPANCTHVLKFLQRINYKVCGMIEKGIIHNKHLVTLFLYEFEV